MRKVDLDFFLLGFKMPYVCDNTDSSGYYSVCVSTPGTYRITYDPLYPYNTNLVAKETLSVPLFSSRVLPDIRLGFGWAVAGQATDTAGKPIDSINLAVDDWVSKKRLFTPGDKTDSLGNYRIVIPNGAYRFRYAPAPGRRQVGLQLDTVKISGRDTVINVTIRSGFFVSATTIDTTFNPARTPIAGVDLDLEDTLGNKIFLPRNTSDSLGKLTVVAPGNMYDFLFVPPRDSHFVAKKVRSFALTSDTSITQTLNRGVLLTVRVVDSLNKPVPFADLDVIREFPPPSNEMFTPTDNADQFGVIKVAVPPDSYTIVINPPAGATNFLADTLPGLVQVLNDTTIDVTLPGQPVRITPPGEERILDAYPNPFRPAVNSFIYFPVDLTALSGNWKALLTIFTPAGEIVFKEEKKLSGGQINGRELFWNGHNDNGEPAASGVYFCKIILRETSGLQRMEKVLKAALIR
ncbi:MAG TPA: hypothetical protein VNL73_02865 [Verrucomicrobiae bacterium]|nr:hypothetical protein [Verrucomicrobiae bacterium]